MKTATLPALRVDPKLREAAERALRPDETLSRLMEAALESYIAQRESEDDFIARGLRSARDARERDRYTTAASVVGKLEKKLILARKSAKSR
jgi:predicted transcriptional regulator